MFQARFLFRILALVFALTAVTGCENLQSPDTNVAEATKQEEQSDQIAGETQEPVEANQDQEIAGSEEVAQTLEQEPVWQFDVHQLLADADAALAADRLTTPIEDNAFDRYHAVLLIEPGNAEALLGLEEIFQRYVGMTQEAIRIGQYGKARALIERARSVDGSSEVVDRLVQGLNQRQRQRARAQPQVVIEPDQTEIALDVEGLNRRDESMVEQLQSLAMQVKDSDDTLLIVARSDSEGRWIYQKMADGVPGYRLRGDIRLGRQPKLLLLPSIE